LSNDPEIRERELTRGRGLAWIRYLTWLYWTGAVGLVPWIVYLFLTQVKRAPAHQVHILTLSLVLAMILGLLATAWLSARDSWLAVMAASFAATTTFISTWFGILAQAGASTRAGAFLAGAFLAVMTAIVVLCVITIRTEVAVLTGTVLSRAGTAPSRAGPHARWLPVALAIAPLALVPSLVIELVVTPGLQIAQHLRLAWTGLDVFELLAMAYTGRALHRRSATAVVPATVTGTLLLCDAWINVISSAAAARSEGIALAFVEIPVAALSFWVATRAMSFATAERDGGLGQAAMKGPGGRASGPFGR
jgi:hypothetical protein